jgi:hypothetical protein
MSYSRGELGCKIHGNHEGFLMATVHGGDSLVISPRKGGLIYRKSISLEDLKQVYQVIDQFDPEQVEAFLLTTGWSYVGEYLGRRTA